MNVVLFGATGMVGQGVLRECLLDAGVNRVVSIVRAATGKQHEKLQEVVHRDFQDFSAIADQLSGFDACFYCLGVASTGVNEEDYTRVTYRFTMAAAEVLAKQNPNLTFVFVSAQGADSSERGMFMWARVKGKTENAVLRLPIRAAYVFRPGMIQPLHGIQSRTRLYRIIYSVMRPVLPLLRRALPRAITTTEQIGRAMIQVARSGAPKKILENPDINAI